MCKLAKFFEGGITWGDLVDMPMSEFMAVIAEANAINDAQRAEIERARRG